MGDVHLHELHLMRANYMSMGDKTCFIRWPNLPPLEQNVWEVKYSMFIPVRLVLSSPAPRAVIELNKNGCKGLLLSSTKMDANKTVVPDIVKRTPWDETFSMLSILKI